MRTRPPLLGYSSYCLTAQQRLQQQREARPDSGTREHLPLAFAAFDTRIDHILIAADAAGRTSSKLQAISKSAAECIGGAGAFLAVVAITH